MVLHGLRGVGKTVLLNKLRDQALIHAWFVVELEGRPGETDDEAVRLGRAVVRAAFQPLRLAHSSDKYRDALGTVKSFANTLGIAYPSNGIDPTPGRGDSGRIEVDLEEVVEDLSLALRETASAFGLFIDEIQDLSQSLLVALLSVQHRAGQNGWPFYVVAAGLPGAPARFSAARSYAERLFDYRNIGALARDEAEKALVLPVRKLGADFDPKALEHILTVSGGYPYFLQTFGQAAWNAAQDPRTISEADAAEAIEVGNQELDMGFFLSRWERVPQAQRQYLRAMANLDDESISTAEIAAALGKPLSKLSVVRQALIEKTLIFAPERGRVSFSVPGMPGYIRRQFDE
jgi:hypothetical protein